MAPVVGSSRWRQWWAAAVGASGVQHPLLALLAPVVGSSYWRQGWAAAQWEITKPPFICIYRDDGDLPHHYEYLEAGVFQNIRPIVTCMIGSLLSRGPTKRCRLYLG